MNEIFFTHQGIFEFEIFYSPCIFELINQTLISMIKKKNKYKKNKEHRYIHRCYQPWSLNLIIRNITTVQKRRRKMSQTSGDGEPKNVVNMTRSLNFMV